MIYQNPKRGQLIRKRIFEEFNQFIQDNPKETQIHFIAHSLGSLILWDILFSDIISNDDSVLLFRDKVKKLDLVS
ncbi:MAG: alpha/beta hydrolase, partial [Nostoc sp.]